MTGPHPEQGTDLKPLFDTILKYVAPPEGDPEAPMQMLVSSVDYNEFVGRMGVGRVQNGVIKVGQSVQVCDWHNPDVHLTGRITKLFDFKANGREPVEQAEAGDIVAFLRFAGYHDRQHAVRPRQGPAAAFCQDQRPHGRNDLLGQRQPVLRARRASTSPPARFATA